jgi:glycosyltransferase involved in cell wall biosynthesis
LGNEFLSEENVTAVVSWFRARHPVLWFIWMEMFVRRSLVKYKADLFFSPDGFMPLSAGVPSCIVIHDINFFHRPNDLPLCSRMYYNYFFPRFARRAKRICTVSEFSANEISSAYHVETSRIKICYNGISSGFRAISNEQKNKIRQSYTDGQPFFIFAGSIHPRKNLVNLLKAFELFRSSGKTMKLVVTGKEFFGNRKLKQVHRKMQYKGDVVFTGPLKQSELDLLMGSAEALTFIPLYEGFGLPVIEAMASDVPVITSDVTSLPETGGDAAIYVDPGDYRAIADAMNLLTDSPLLKKELIKKGRIQKTKFSWDKTAECVWQTLESLNK